VWVRNPPGPQGSGVLLLSGSAARPAPLAQLVEQWTFNPLVAGSSPAGGTMNKKEFINLPEDEQNKLIEEAFNYLCQTGVVPYGIQTGDDDTWDNYDPAVQLATEWYENE
jgi:hypothetical protein